MFIRQCYRRRNGKRHAYWALVESYRAERGPRQRVVAWLGKLDEARRLGLQQAAGDNGGAPSSGLQSFGKPSSETQLMLFDEGAAETEPRWVEVNVSAVRVENCRQFGGPWLALKLVRRLKLDEFLTRVMPAGRERVPWSLSSLVLVIGRLLDPSSELHTSEQWYPKTALPELLGVSVCRVNDNRLYRTLDELRPHKGALEAHQAPPGRTVSPRIYFKGRGLTCC